MIDYTLKFPDEATAAEMLEPFVQTHSIDVIGVIQKPSGNTINTQEGLMPVMVSIPGWHVNVRGPDADKFAKYEVVVNSPERGWF